MRLETPAAAASSPMRIKPATVRSFPNRTAARASVALVAEPTGLTTSARKPDEQANRDTTPAATFTAARAAIRPRVTSQRTDTQEGI
ncbi:hypothetical protein GCM10009682_51060 [Luedemannella flava]|uniref:Uncharacterized protein n=1 Tax=Luedemannella flava TaxID=349316 RepID=A0ABN2MF82_9ACTN